MKNILFVNNALSGTGGARVILNLAKVLVERGNSVSILLDRVDNIDFEIPKGVMIFVRNKNNIVLVQNVKVHAASVNIKNYTNKNSYKFRPLKNIIKKILTYINFLKISRQLKNYKNFIKQYSFDLIVNNNIYLNLDRSYFESCLSKNYWFNFHNSPGEVFSRPDFNHVMPLSKIFSKSNILTVSHDIARELGDIKGFEKNTIKTIYNPFDFKVLKEKADLNYSGSITLPEKYIITVSTLTSRKRVDRTIYAFKKIIKNDPELKLVILGDGELRLKLNDDVKKLGMENDVIFLGFQPNPYYYISKAKLLMLTSDSEGLPTVLIESLILGVPVVSTDCPTGPAEILCGWGEENLVKISPEYSDQVVINELADKASKVISHSYTSDEIAIKSGLERFEEKVIAKQWEELAENYD
ncbi:glycosyltransferase [uncultured Enterobacter sp.]|uniref:glycosyltransferase n=1 Tax=uncultured Enterobacter sp. TaxID=238202 RepID=UPI002619D7DB|nr:glycosyltransferase [uncultured Enterobacter sp.]